MEQHQYHLTEEGKAAVVRNGCHPERDIQTGICPVTVKIPKVRNRAGDPVVFHSALVPPYIGKTPTFEAVIPWLYLKGVFTGEMRDALSLLVGKDAAGLSASTVSRLKKDWADQYHAWRKQDLSKDEWFYIWANVVYSGLRAEDTKLCVLVLTSRKKNTFWQ